METNSTYPKEESKTPNPLSGLDLNGLLSNNGVMEVLKHLLSGAGAMAGNYFMWIKPIQEKLESLNNTIAKLEERISELEADKEDEQDSEDEDDELLPLRSVRKNKANYLPVRKRETNTQAKSRYRNVEF